LIITEAGGIQEEDMGLLDIINGMQNGPRGQPQPTGTKAGGGGGMSPIMMALLGLVAYKAVKSVGGGGQPASPGGAGRPASLPSGGTVSAGHPGGGIGDILGGLLGGKPGSAPTINVGANSGNVGASSGGSLKDLLPGGLGGLLGGATAGTVLSGGLGSLIKEFQDSGHGRAAQSWVGTGPNEKIAPHELASALGDDTIDALSRQTGVAREELLAGLSQHLPDLINQLTPHGRLPTEQEASRMI
jgi:uncharacterized protein YidB (DUF937 family)